MSCYAIVSFFLMIFFFLCQMPSSLNLEENYRVVFFTCNTESLLGCHYERLGQVIVHSVLNEGPAFLCLPKAIYYYMVGGTDAVVPHLSLEELPAETQYVVKKVRSTFILFHLAHSISFPIVTTVTNK